MTVYSSISWQDFHHDTCLLIPQCQALNPSWTGIIAVTRGGLIPAAILAHALNVRLIETVCLSSYSDTDQQQGLEILKDFSNNAAGMLVVDDLVDSGETFQHLRSRLVGATYAAVYAKPAGQPATDLYACSFPQDTWIVFPWEESDN